jgi:dolichol kinase
MNQEILRQGAHIVYGLFILVGLWYDIFIWPMFLFLIAFGVILSMLLAQKVHIPIVSFIANYLERDSEKRGFRAQGFLAFNLGCLLVVLLFSKEIALASIAMLTFGDAFATLIGVQGRMRYVFNVKKTVEGIIAGGLTGGIAASLFIPWQISFMLSFLIFAIEALDLRLFGWKIDDNLFLPLLTGLLLVLV